MKRNTAGTKTESPEEARKGGDGLRHRDAETGKQRLKERIRAGEEVTAHAHCPLPVRIIQFNHNVGQHSDLL